MFLEEAYWRGFGGDRPVAWGKGRGALFEQGSSERCHYRTVTRVYLPGGPCIAECSEGAQVGGVGAGSEK